MCVSVLMAAESCVHIQYHIFKTSYVPYYTVTRPKPIALTEVPLNTFYDVPTAELGMEHIMNFFILISLKRNQMNIHNSRETLWLSFSCFAYNLNRHTELHDWYCKHTGITSNLMTTSIKLIKPSYHYGDVIMGAMASQITSLTIVYSNVYSGADQRKHQSSASLTFVWGIDRWPVNSPYKEPVTWKMFPFDH